MKKSSRSQRIARVARILEAHALADNLQITEQTTATAQQAADVVGCLLGQIAKSLVWQRAQAPDVAIVTVLSGDCRCDERALAQVTGGVVRARSGFVVRATGYDIGGVCPLGLDPSVTILLDEGLWRFGTIWLAAGSAHALFSIEPDRLAEITGGKRVAIATSSASSESPLPRAGDGGV